MTSDIHKDQEGASLVPRPSITANALAVIEGLGTRLEGARTKPRGLIPRSHFFVLGTRLMWWSPILTANTEHVNAA